MTSLGVLQQNQYLKKLKDQVASTQDTQNLVRQINLYTPEMLWHENIRNIAASFVAGGNESQRNKKAFFYLKLRSGYVKISNHENG